MDSLMLQKYDIPLPRYTSFPAVPYWNPQSIDVQTWKKNIQETFRQENKKLSVYIHLPFCEELCTYCACNKRVTKNHQVELPYIESLLAEWRMYLNIFEEKPILEEIHLGGGTPTFFSPQNLSYFLHELLKTVEVSAEHEFSIEVHPNYTSYQHLEELSIIGFRRISLGVQDFDKEVQYIINRPQTFEQTKKVVEWARQLDYQSINIDLVYGLPKQSVGSFTNTLHLVRTLQPNRIALYSYAHVPWKSKAQRRYSEEDLPDARLKWEIYQTAYQYFTQNGWQPIGMDHFALPSDNLFIAYQKGKLHRNFMGYTTNTHRLLIGLGCSSISDTWTAFAQNEKEVEAYQQKVQQKTLPIFHGHLLSEQDKVIRKHILNLMCRHQTTIQPADFELNMLESIFKKLLSLERDELLQLQGNTVVVTEKGRLFVRVICAAFDNYLQQNLSFPVFSKAI
ncbi:MAG: oxygen-independent coproporphyrinogen III oxidase [Cytophagales bacterium]|nr:oxygen-independent coproporphyrinogen III oxidase [Cytophagales bacterium]